LSRAAPAGAVVEVVVEVVDVVDEVVVVDVVDPVLEQARLASPHPVSCGLP
jgi:hypothetical protein